LEFKAINRIIHKVIGKVENLDATIAENSDIEGEEDPFKIGDLHSLIKVDDSKIDQDKYKQIISKFYSVIRYKMYHSIQDYWKIHGKKIMVKKML